jgi:hypothetical protein
MKKVLSLLVAFVFLQVQSWALSGGPVFTTTSANPSIIGTYGGVMIPTSTQTNTAIGATGANDFTPASIGLFSIAVPETGISSGVAIVFVDGVAFIGQIAGVGDGDRQEIQGVIAGTSNFTVHVEISPPIIGIPPNPSIPAVFADFPIFAEGSFKADIIEGDAGAFTPAPAGSGNPGSSSSSATTSSTAAEVGSTNAARIVGTAQIATFFTTSGGEPNFNVLAKYSMDGIKQSNIPNPITTLGFSFSGPGS